MAASMLLMALFEHAMLMHLVSTEHTLRIIASMPVKKLHLCKHHDHKVGVTSK